MFRWCLSGVCGFYVWHACVLVECVCVCVHACVCVCMHACVCVCVCVWTMLGRAFKVSRRIHSFSVLHFHASNSVRDLDPVSGSQGCWNCSVTGVLER